MNFLSKKNIYAMSSNANIRPNTYIGGVASTINTKALLASKLGIPEARIKMFRIVNDDVQANITGTYSISGKFNGDTSITHYDDKDGLVITSGNSTFVNCTSLTYIYLPSSTFAGSNICGGCINLVSAYIPKCTTLATNGQFFNCKSLISINVPLVSEIGYDTFQGCTSLVSVNIPLFNGVGSGRNIFQGCISLKAVDFPLCTVLNQTTFSGCTSLKSVNLPLLQSVTHSTFFNCSSLTTISLPSLDTVGSSTFSGCTSLVSAYVPLLQNIGISCFLNCSSLATINLSNVATIAATAFRNTAFTNVSLPLCTQIGNQAFYGCTSLVSISAPVCTNVQSGETFRLCTSLTMIYLPLCTQLGSGTTSTSIFLGIATNCTITVNIFLWDCNAGSPDGDLISANTSNIIYHGAQPSINFKIGGVSGLYNTINSIAPKLGVARAKITNFQIIDSDIHFAVAGSFTIAQAGFEGLSQLTFIEDLGNNVVNISTQAFRNCPNLIYAIFGTNLTTTVTTSGSTSGVFYNCTSLQYVLAPNIVTIGQNSFIGCTSLNSLNYPLLTSVGSNCFQNCSSIVNVNLPELIGLSGNSFQNCIGLKTFSATKCTILGSGSNFYNCTSIEKIDIPKCTSLGLSTANNNVFQNIKLGCVINVNIALQTANAGLPDGDLTYAVESRGATINYIP